MTTGTDATVTSFEELRALDAEHVMQTYGRLPVAFVRGEGTVLWDSEGRRYLDFLGGLAVTSLGHAHPAVADAVADQARTLLHVSNLYYNALQPRLAARLDALLGGGGRVFFANSGAEANECAIKLRAPPRPDERRAGASRDRRRLRLLPRAHAHDARRDRAAPEARALPAAAPGVPPRAVRRPRRPHGRPRRAGVRGAARGRAGRRRRAAGTARLPARPSVRCVTSGRCCSSWTRSRPGSAAPGAGSASSTPEVRPDVVTLAKALGNGVPIGACWAREEVAAAFRAGDHASTFGGQPLAAPRRARRARRDGGRGRARLGRAAPASASPRGSSTCRR